MVNNSVEKAQAENATSLKTQVIIIGAGPAGAASSVFLTKAGIHHIILEKEIFPRDKVCGDACSGKTVFVLRKANPAWVEEIFGNASENIPTYGVIFGSPNGRTLDIPFNLKNLLPGQAPGFVTPRLIFDNFLFEKIASPFANVYQEASVKNIERKESGVTVQFEQDNEKYEITAPLIIGADGDKSIVRKVLFKQNVAGKAYCVGLRAYYKGVTGMHEKNFIELHFIPEVLPGYLWIFPLANGMANVGIGMMSDKIREKKINLREEMLKALKNNPDLSPRFKNAELTEKILGWGLPMAMKRQRLSGDNFLLTGDAGSLIDPFSGEGIGNALFSGMLAAYAAEEALKAGKYNDAFLKRKYDDVLYKKIGDELRKSALLQKFCHYPWFFNYVVNKAHKSPTLNTAITSMFTGVDLKKQLMKPSFYAKILLNK